MDNDEKYVFQEPNKSNIKKKMKEKKMSNTFLIFIELYMEMTLKLRHYTYLLDAPLYFCHALYACRICIKMIIPHQLLKINIRRGYFLCFSSFKSLVKAKICTITHKVRRYT